MDRVMRRIAAIHSVAEMTSTSLDPPEGSTERRAAEALGDQRLVLLQKTPV